MVARETEAQHFGWRSVVGRVLAKTTIFFMLMAAIDIVANYAQPAGPRAAPGRRRLHHRLCAAGSDLGPRADPGADRSPRRRRDHRIRAWQCHRYHPRAGQCRAVRNRDRRHPRQSWRKRHRVGRRPRIGGIAIGLAAQGIFADLFAALSILFDKPFRRGDIVRYGTTTGTVEKIGLKTTRLRGVGGEQVIMSNTKLLEQELHNVTDARVRRTWLPFGLIYQTPPETIERLQEIVTEAVDSIKGCKTVRCSRLRSAPAQSTASSSTTTARAIPTHSPGTSQRSSSA